MNSKIGAAARPAFRRARLTPPNEEPLIPEIESLRIKEAAFREALNNAWFATALEQTKSVFTLASAGVGLALTLEFSEHTKKLPSWAPTWLFLAAAAFAVSAVLCVWVFRINGKLVQLIICDVEHANEDSLVGRVDWTSRMLFALGILFLLLAAFNQVWL